MRVERPVIAVKIIAPHVADQLFARQRDAAVSNEIEKQIVFARRHIDLFPVHINETTRKIDGHAVEMNDILFCLFLRLCTRAVHDGADAHHQFPRRKRLDDIIVDAELEAVDLIVFLAARRKHNHRRRAELADLAAGGKTVQFGHHDIHDDQIERLLSAKFDRLHAVRRFGHGMAFKFRVFSNDLTNALFVVDDQKMIGHARLLLFCKKDPCGFGRKPQGCFDCLLSAFGTAFGKRRRDGHGVVAAKQHKLHAVADAALANVALETRRGRDFLIVDRQDDVAGLDPRLGRG